MSRTRWVTVLLAGTLFAAATAPYAGDPSRNPQEPAAAPAASDPAKGSPEAVRASADAEPASSPHARSRTSTIEPWGDLHHFDLLEAEWSPFDFGWFWPSSGFRTWLISDTLGWYYLPWMSPLGWGYDSWYGGWYGWLPNGWPAGGFRIARDPWVVVSAVYLTSGMAPPPAAPPTPTATAGKVAPAAPSARPSKRDTGSRGAVLPERPGFGPRPDPGPRAFPAPRSMPGSGGGFPTRRR